MKLVQRLTKLHSRLQRLHVHFGEPQYVRLFMRKAYINNGIKTFENVEVLPTPRSQFVKSSLVGLAVNERARIFIDAKDLEVTEVIREYDLKHFTEDVLFFVYPDLTTGGIEYDQRGFPKGDFYTLIHAYDNDPTTYKFILRKTKDDFRDGGKIT
jgi:hypothetical protein